MDIQRMITGFELYEVPDTGDSGEYNPKRGSSQLLGVLGLYYLDFTCGFYLPELLMAIFLVKLSRHESHQLQVSAGGCLRAAVVSAPKLQI